MQNANVIELGQALRRCGQLPVRQLCLPAGVDPLERERLEAIVRRRRAMQAGQWLFREGEPFAAVYVAQDGAFKTVSLSEDGDEQVVAFHLPGELIGLDALGGGMHRCDAVALEATDVCELEFEALASAAASLPRLQQQLLRVIGQSVDRDQEHLAMLLRRHAHERVAAFLQDLGERYCRLGHEARTLRLPMPRDDIARFLGLALETVSRSLSRLQDEGIVEVSGRRVTVRAPERLARVAGGEAAEAAPPMPRRM